LSGEVEAASAGLLDASALDASALDASALDASTEPAVMAGALECSGTCGGPDGALP
jgi:hypothetical protein